MIAVRIKRALFATVSLSVGFLLSLLVLELALRVVDWPSPGLYQGGSGPLPLSIATAEGSSWRSYPGKARLRHWDYDVPIELNSHGFIERENAEKADGVWRIGLFGDSFTAGMGVEIDERFGRIWWRAIAERMEPPIEVYNFGSAWSGTGQSAAFLQGHGDEYAIDEIVLALFGGNELEDNENWDRHRTLEPAEQLSRGRHELTLRERIRNESRAAGFLYVYLVRTFAKKETVVPRRSYVDEHWAPTERALREFVDAAGTRPLTIWYLPSTTEWDDASWQSVQSELDIPDADRHAVRDRVREWATRAGIPFVDTTAFLTGSRVEEIRFARDGHWNARGHRIVANGLIESSEASHWQRTSGGREDSASR